MPNVPLAASNTRSITLIRARYFPPTGASGKIDTSSPTCRVQLRDGGKDFDIQRIDLRDRQNMRRVGAPILARRHAALRHDAIDRAAHGLLSDHALRLHIFQSRNPLIFRRRLALFRGGLRIGARFVDDVAGKILADLVGSLADRGEIGRPAGSGTFRVGVGRTRLCGGGGGALDIGV